MGLDDRSSYKHTNEERDQDTGHEDHERGVSQNSVVLIPVAHLDFALARKARFSSASHSRHHEWCPPSLVRKALRTGFVSKHTVHFLSILTV